MMYFTIGLLLSIAGIFYVLWRDARRERKGWEIINEMEARFGSDNKGMKQ